MATRSKVPPLLTEEVISGNRPGAPNIGIPPDPGTAGTITAPLAQEFVAAGGYQWYANYVRSLPQYIDDLTDDFAADFYERMLLDADCRSAVTILKASVLEDGLHLAPAVEDKKDKSYDDAHKIADFCTNVLADMTTSMDDVLWDMMDAIAVGNRVAEQVYVLDSYRGGPVMLQLKALKTKPRENLAFVVDTFHEHIGFLGLIPGQGYPVLQGTMLTDPSKVPNLLPREKFAVLTFRPKNNDPRGTSVLRPAYQAWWHKMQMWPEYLRYLTQFASPLLVGTAAPQSIPQLDPATGNIFTPEQFLLQSLQGIRNGSAVAVPPGTLVNLHYSMGAGEAFMEAMDHYGRQIAISILSQTLATGEGRHNARAAAQVHQDILGIIVKQIKKAPVRMITRDILRPLVRYNFGDEASHYLLPRASLGETAQEDQAKLLTALATVPGFKMYASQLQDSYNIVGLPEADPDEVQSDIQATIAGQQMAIQGAQQQPDSITAPRAPKPPTQQKGAA